MTVQQVVGMLALVILVVGIVIYRVVWFLGREKRRRTGVRWFKSDSQG
jgi:hypothetical protein